MKVRCPTCKEWLEWASSPLRPFCSARCKGADLGKWANEEYRVPEEEADDGEAPAVPPATRDES